MTPCKRKCWQCGNIAMHEDNIVPHVNCKKCGSQDTRLIREKPGKPSHAGHYWALWLTASPGTHEGDQLTPAPEWEVVQVWENFIGDPCEADGVDESERWGVSVAGVRETQWLENFKWGAFIPEPFTH